MFLPPVLTPVDQSGNTYRISGISVGSGNTLYLDRILDGKMTRVDKTTGAWIADFPTAHDPAEGIECDPVNFYPKVVMWERSTTTNKVRAYELLPNTCECGGGAPSDSAGVNKDLENTTGQAADAIDILVQGSYPNVHHWDGYAQNHFATFTIIPEPPNTRFRWSNPNNVVQPGTIAHVGINVPGSTLFILGVYWRHNGAGTGCAHQTQTNTHLWGSAGSQVIYANGCRSCEQVSLYVGMPIVEWHASQVPLGDLNANTNRHPMRVDTIPGGPVLLAPGELRAVDTPGAPDGARFGVIIHKVSGFSNLAHATTDFLQFQVGSDVAGVPPDQPAGTSPGNGLQISNNPLMSGATEIRFTLERPDRVEVRLFAISGRLVRTLAAGALPAGEQSLRWDGRDDHGDRLPPGVYFAQVTFVGSGLRQARQVVVLK